MMNTIKAITAPSCPSNAISNAKRIKRTKNPKTKLLLLNPMVFPPLILTVFKLNFLIYNSFVYFILG